MSALPEILRNFRRNIIFIGGAWGIAEGCALAAGANPVPGDLAGLTLGAAASVLAYRSVHEPVLRRFAHRPRRVMTPGDYRRLRELEAELGWEPSEPCMPVEVPTPAPPVTQAQYPGTLTASGGAFSVAASLSGSGTLSAKARVMPSLPGAWLSTPCECPAGTRSGEVHVPGNAVPVARYCLTCGKHRRPVAPQRDYRGVWSTSGSSRCLCPACHHAMRESRGRLASDVAAEHFAALARVGRESCIGFCPICAERSES